MAELMQEILGRKLQVAQGNRGPGKGGRKGEGETAAQKREEK